MQVAIILVDRRDLLDPCIQQPTSTPRGNEK
jgi:hypothetical protein